VAKSIETLFRSGAYTEDMDAPRDIRASQVLTPRTQLIEFKQEERAARADPLGGLKTTAEQFASSLADTVTGAGRGIAALASTGIGLGGELAYTAARALDVGSPESRAAARAAVKSVEGSVQGFARDASGEALLRDISFLSGGDSGVENENRYARNYLAREKAYPGTTFFARAAGLVVPLVATAGAAGATVGAETGSGLLANTARTLLSPAGISQTAIGGALQGLTAGAAAPFETMQDTPISREAILASGAMGAVLGGTLGAVVGTASKYAPGVLAGVFGKTASAEEKAAAQAEIKAAIPDSIRGLEHSEIPAERELFRIVSEKADAAGKVANEMTDRIRSAINAAGPNPELRKAAAAEAAQAEVERFSGKAKEIAPENWRDSALTPDEIVRNREVLKEGAKNEIADHLGNLVNESNSVMEHLRSFEQKESLVRKNLAGLSDAQATGAIQGALDHVQSVRREFEGLFEGAEGLRPTRTTESLGFSLNRAEEAVAKAPDATAAHRALDQLRRDVNGRLASLMRQTTSTLADDAYEGAKLFKFADQAYESTRLNLANPELWGEQGRLQLKVNQAWADDIAAEGRVTKLGSFFSRDVNERYGRQAARVDPDKIGKYLDGLGKKTLPDQDLRAMVERKAALMKEVSAAYDIPAEKVAKAIESAKQLGSSIEAANKVMTTAGGLETTIANILGARVSHLAAHAGGGAVGGLAGAMVGGPVGSVVGALAGHSIGGAVEEFAAHRVPQLVGKLFSAVKGYRPNAVPVAYQRALNRNVSSMIPAGARGLFAATSDAGRAAQLDQYKKRSEVLAQLQQPGATLAVGERVMGQYDKVQPTLGASAQIAAKGLLGQLAANWPGTTEVSPVPSRNRALVSDQDIRTANARWEATADPFSVFTDFEKGNADPEKVAFAWAQYPELQQLFQAAALDAINQLPEEANVPMDRLSSLDQLLGMGGQLDPSLRPDFMARQLERGAALRAEEEQQQPNAAAAGRIAQQHQTEITRVMGA
jgi:hypothetical protein